jgi:hypothetical protein
MYRARAKSIYSTALASCSLSLTKEHILTYHGASQRRTPHNQESINTVLTSMRCTTWMWGGKGHQSGEKNTNNRDKSATRSEVSGNWVLHFVIHVASPLSFVSISRKRPRGISKLDRSASTSSPYANRTIWLPLSCQRLCNSCARRVASILCAAWACA